MPPVTRGWQWESNPCYPFTTVNANTLRLSALALCYSVAEYCCPVWQRSTHVSLVDAQLHSSMRLISGTVQSTALPWLPVLTNIEPPVLWRRAATDKLIMQAECHHDWPLYDDVFHPPPLRLESRKPLWRDLQSIDVTSWWREDWQSATVVNSTLVVDPTIRLPGFDLHRRQWSLLNRFRTGQGHCNACHKKWGFTDNELCDRAEIQIMSHIVNFCPLTKFDGGLLRLNEADEAAVDWLTTYGS